MANRPLARAVRVLVVAWAVIILVLSVTAPLPGAGILPDKAVHFAAYAVLTVLLRRSLGAAGVGPPALLAVAAAVSYGALIEAIQAFLPWRRAEWWDLGANALGAVLGALPRGRARGR